jgi:Protein of unknown function (DUF2637)
VKLPKLRLPRRRERPDRPDGMALRWNRLAIIAALPVAVVATIAGIVSYSHIVALGLRTHQGAADSHLLPLSVDGLIVAGSVILAAGSPLGWLGVALGVGATLFANLQFGLPHGALSAAASTWPAVAFSVATFMLERWLRPRAAEGQPDALWQQVPADSLDAAIHAMLATAAAGNPLSGRQLEARFGLKRNAAAKVRELVLASQNGHPGETPPAE